jgi:hypothetical protein
MQLLQKLLTKFNGLRFKQEYLCLAKETFPDPLNVYLISEKKVIRDITNHHLFIGYSPLVFTFPSFNEINLSQSDHITIAFTQKDVGSNEIFSKKDALATIYFKKISKHFANHTAIYFYKGVKAEHRFLNSFHQFILQLSNDLYNKKPGNVFLADNLYKQVQVAYAVPRNISLITVKQSNLFNLFPTDLHGQIDDRHYIISLRRGGMAAQQVETIKKILISEVRAEFYKTAYSLGKNHMRELKGKDQFLFDSRLSQVLQLPLPQSATHYRELELLDSFEHGIHRFFLLKIINQGQIENRLETLAHVHNVYATWRHSKGLPGNYLLR